MIIEVDPDEWLRRAAFRLLTLTPGGGSMAVIWVVGDTAQLSASQKIPSMVAALLSSIVSYMLGQHVLATSTTTRSTPACSVGEQISLAEALNRINELTVLVDQLSSQLASPAPVRRAAKGRENMGKGRK